MIFSLSLQLFLLTAWRSCRCVNMAAVDGARDMLCLQRSGNQLALPKI